MTQPVLTAVPPTLHRRQKPTLPSDAHQAMADRIRAALNAQDIVTVEVFGGGRGWYVTAVGDGLYDLWRDGTTMQAVPWTSVNLDR